MVNNKKTFITRLTHNINFLENVADSSSADPVWQEKYNCFSEIIPLSDCKYMSIEGMSFGNLTTVGVSDSHINSIIIEAIKNYTLELFVIVPSGSDVVVKNRYLDEDDKAIIENAIVGVSRRTLDKTFKDTGVEYSKINRFFE